MNPDTTPSRRRRPRALLLIGAIVALLAIGVSAAYVVADRITEPGPPVVGVSEIAVRDNSFSPDAIEVVPGTTVTWTWEGNAKHNLHGDGIDAPAQSTGAYSQTFTEPGTYDYECTLHFGMKGRVIVAEPAGS